MRQHCDFRRIENTDEHQCGNCGKIVNCTADNPLSLCDVHAEDPPQCDPAALPCSLRGEYMAQLPATAPGCRHELTDVYRCSRHGCATVEIKVSGVQACTACLERPDGQISLEPLELRSDGWRIPADAPLTMHVILSPQFGGLFRDFFRPSLERLQDDGLALITHPLDCDGNGDFGTDDYTGFLQSRCRLIAEILRGMPAGELAVFADVDIVFLARFRERLVAEMAGFDMGFMNEAQRSPETLVNFGFFAARPTPEVIALMELVADETRAGMLDQDLGRQLLPTSGIRWRKLSDVFSNTNLRTTLSAPRDLLFHAIGTQPRQGKTSIELKRELLANVLAARLSREVVVSRHCEPPEWLGACPVPVLLYDKSGARRLPDAVPLENVGREAETYAQHIVRHYESLAAVTYFVQGRPFDHSPRLASDLRLPRPETGFRDVSTVSLECPPDYAESNGDTQLSEAWAHLFPGIDPPDRFQFGAGAQFAVTREQIRRRPRSFYERVLDVSLWRWGPWLLERLWPIIFSDFHADQSEAPRVPAAPKPTTRLQSLEALVPFLESSPADLERQAAHLDRDELYEPGTPRYICSILGALHDELSDRPSLQRWVLEATRMARRIDIAAGGQDHMQWELPTTQEASA